MKWLHRIMCRLGLHPLARLLNRERAGSARSVPEVRKAVLAVNSDESRVMVEPPDDAAIERAWHELRIAVRQQSDLAVAGARSAYEELIAARVRAEAAVGECAREDCQQIAHTASVVYCELTGGKLSYPTYPASTVVAEANDYTQQLIDEECARVRAEAVAAERQRLADAVLPDHWQTVEMWGGVQRLACGRCRHGDGVRFLWPCSTRRAITGEPEPEPDSSRLAAGSVPVATPPTCEHGLEVPHPWWPVQNGKAERCPGPVATPTHPEGLAEAIAERRADPAFAARLAARAAADRPILDALAASPVATPTEPDEPQAALKLALRAFVASRKECDDEYCRWCLADELLHAIRVAEAAERAASPAPAAQPEER